jgi:polyribonucleotide nucleotidyltransferase
MFPGKERALSVTPDADAHAVEQASRRQLRNVTAGSTISEEEEQKLEQYVQGLERRGVRWETIPAAVRPDLRYLTAAAAAESGETVYSRQHIERLIEQGSVDGFVVAGRALITPRGLKQLSSREQASVAGQLRRGGHRLPGSSAPARRGGRRQAS